MVQGCGDETAEVIWEWMSEHGVPQEASERYRDISLIVIHSVMG